MGLIETTVAMIRPADPAVREAAWERQNDLTKPRGALGDLERLAVRIAAATGTVEPQLQPAAVAVFAADHGVHARGVSPWPQEVTAQMAAAVVGGGAAVSVFARQVGAPVVVVDLGIAGEIPGVPAQGEVAGLRRPRICPVGTADMTLGRAMTREQVRSAMEVGIRTAQDLLRDGARMLVAGDLGIANTTASAALVAAFSDSDPELVTGRGTGIDDATHALKIDVVRRALEVNQIDTSDPVGVLAAVGGLEHAAIAGFLLAAAAHRTPAVLDGVIACSAALAAHELCPDAVDHWVAGHRSAEPGAATALAVLGLEPVLDLQMRLGEGSGAVLAVPVVQAACAVMSQMATFSGMGMANEAEQTDRA